MNNITETELLNAIEKAETGFEKYRLEYSRYQLSKEEAQAMKQSRLWEVWSHEQIFRFQIYQRRFCFTNYKIFIEATTRTLGRMMYIHEFMYPEAIRMEYWGMKASPTSIEHSITFLDINKPGKKIKLLSHYN